MEVFITDTMTQNQLRLVQRKMTLHKLDIFKKTGIRHSTFVGACCCSQGRISSDSNPNVHSCHRPPRTKSNHWSLRWSGTWHDDRQAGRNGEKFVIRRCCRWVGHPHQHLESSISLDLIQIELRLTVNRSRYLDRACRSRIAMTESISGLKGLFERLV